MCCNATMAVVPTATSPYLAETRKRPRREPIELIEIKREKSEMEGKFTRIRIVFFYANL